MKTKQRGVLRLVSIAPIIAGWSKKGTIGSAGELDTVYWQLLLPYSLFCLLVSHNETMDKEKVLG